MEERKIEDQRFEFLLYINGNIICQRFFHIKGYNEKSLNSFELNNMSHECVQIIKDDLKLKTRNYLWKYFDPYKDQLEDEINHGSIYNKIDDFQFEVKVDGNSVIKREFSGNPYPPKVRYQVNIKDVTHDIIRTVRQYLTKKKYTYDYEMSDVIVQY